MINCIGKNSLFPIIGILLMISCSQQTEEITEEEFIPKATRDYDYEDDTLETEEILLDSFQIELQNTFENITFPEKNSLHNRNVKYFPNRVGYEKKTETFFLQDSTAFRYLSWGFSDSLTTINAFYNWLDCLGPNCMSLRIDDEKNIDSLSFGIWMDNHSIIYLESTDNIPFQDWEQSLIISKTKEWNYILWQRKNSVLQWKLTPESSIN